VDQKQAFAEYEDAEKELSKAAVWMRDMDEQLMKAERAFLEAKVRCDAAEQQWRHIVANQ
jgi:hypothetical protein